MPLILQNTATWYRSWILYEVLLDRSVDEAYKNFRQNTKNNDFYYVEFVHWFNRFSNGNLDLDNESFDKKPLTFSELPIEIVGEIVGNLDSKSQLKTRTVSRFLRNVVDMQTAHYQIVSIISGLNSIEVYIDGHWFRYTKKAGERFSVCQHDKACQPPRKGNFLEVALNNLKYALKRPNLQLEKLVLTLEASQFDEQFLQLFESLNSPIHVKMLNINARGDMDVVRVLSTMKPGTLESIHIANWQTEYHARKVVKMEQWKQAKQISLPWANKNPFGVEDFLHFDRIRCSLSHVSARTTISPEDVIRLRDAFSHSSGFEYCYMRLWKPNSTGIADIGRALGARVRRDRHGSELIIYRYPIPGSNEFLDFDISKIDLFIKRTH